jgi:heat shock protein HslJ
MKRIISIAVAILMFSGVAIAVEKAGGEPNSSLEKTYWKLTELGGKGVAPSKNVKREPHIVLEPEKKRVAGSSGCNRLMGGYELKGKDITFKGMTSTRMACPPDIMKTESAFLKALNETRGWKIVGDKLTLVGGKGKKLAEFKAMNMK